MNLKKPIKNIVIFGDSYSTYDQYVPEGYAIWYSADYKPETDVFKVEDTWWHGLSTELSLNLVRNDSWSGSTICYTGYMGDCSKTNSFIYRMEKLAEEGFFRDNEIDTVFVFGGTNDCWAGAPLGELKFDNIERNDLFAIRPAIAYMVGRLKELLPEANIIFLVNTELKPEIEETARLVSEHFGTAYLAFDHIEKMHNHPCIQGMKEIKEQVKAFLAE